MDIGHAPTQQVFPSARSTSNPTSASTPDEAQRVHLRMRAAHSKLESQTLKPRTTPGNLEALSGYSRSAWLSAASAETTSTEADLGGGEADEFGGINFALSIRRGKTPL